MDIMTVSPKKPPQRVRPRLNTPPRFFMPQDIEQQAANLIRETLEVLGDTPIRPITPNEVYEFIRTL